MNNEEKVAAVNHWQDDVDFHPLTCPNHPDRGVLFRPEIWQDPPHYPALDIEAVPEQRVVLRCPECEYVQSWIPQVVLDAYRRKQERALEFIGHTDPGDDERGWG